MVSSENFDDYMKEVGKQDVGGGLDAYPVLWAIGAMAVPLWKHWPYIASETICW